MSAYSSQPSGAAAPSSSRWWKQSREQVTTTGASQKGITQYWEGAAGQAPNAPASRAERTTRSQASHVNLATGDDLEGTFAVTNSHYKELFCSAHKKVGRRGVALSDEALKAVSCPETSVWRKQIVF